MIGDDTDSIVVMFRRSDGCSILLDYNDYRVWMIPQLRSAPESWEYLEGLRTKTLPAIGYEDIGSLDYCDDGTVTATEHDNVTPYIRNKLDQILDEYREVFDRD